EWLNAHAAAGYIDYEAGTCRYILSPEQAMMFADESSPAFFVGAFQTALAAAKIQPALERAFKTGEGVGWDAHDHQLFHGVERFFRSGYVAHLVADWIPALDGVMQRLKEGIRVADMGCGFGASTILMAQAFPKSMFIGFDAHPESIAAARQRAEAAGVTANVQFEVATAKNFPGSYELVTTFDALHDLGDPEGAAAHVLSALQPDGTWMIVEPYAEDRTEQNFHPVGRAYYAASTLICTPCSMAQEVGLALGAQAGEARLRDIITKGGFRRFRRATETPFNLVLEARP
ncbi:MAG: methyltransferase domain-containing protein, partial [Bryobacterales bacterium]|nr:methyltransferase domain-containing protein [Bryobacterales bacterium]